MRTDRFVAEHRVVWKRLDELVQKAQSKRLSSLSNDELLELGTLYRRAASDLARVKTRYTATHAGRELARSLNDLVLRAHTQVYSAPAPRPMRLLRFVLYGFPETVRRQWKPIALAALLLYGSALLAYLVVLFDFHYATLFVSDEIVRAVQQRAQQKSLTGWGATTDFPGLMASPAISSYIMTNNIIVSALAVAEGVTAGIGTVRALIQNGLMLGGLSGVATHYHVDLLYWAVILPHGIIELSAISVAAGAGFVLARALFAPGDLPRRDALRLAGGEAARLMAGVALMLVVAGIIEGFITPLPLSPYLKLSFAALTVFLLLVYLNARPRAGFTLAEE